MVNILLFKQSPVASRQSPVASRQIILNFAIYFYCKKLLKSYSNYLLTLESLFMDKIIYSNVFIDFNFKGGRK